MRQRPEINFSYELNLDFQESFRPLENQVDISSSQEIYGNFNKSGEKSPLRSILKKSPSTSSAIFATGSPRNIEICIEVNKSKSLSSLYEPTFPIDLQKSKGQSIRFGNLKAIDNSVSKHSENNLSTDNEISRISETIPYESNKPKSLLTALIQETEVDLHQV